MFRLVIGYLGCVERIDMVRNGIEGDGVCVVRTESRTVQKEQRLVDTGLLRSTAPWPKAGAGR
jgi:hypothetical protein